MNAIFPAQYAVDVVDLVREECRRLDYWFPGEDSHYDLFLFGVRHPNARLGQWDDVLGAIMRIEGVGWRYRLWPGTTDPGVDGDRKDDPRLHVDGTAILVPGQYRGCWTLGLHRAGTSSEHEAFRQHRPMRFWRDHEQDGVRTTGGRVLSDTIGCNGHRPYKDGLGRVGVASLACQVWQWQRDHAEAMGWAHLQQAAHPTWRSYSYTLFQVDPVPGAPASPSLRALLRASAVV